MAPRQGGVEIVTGERQNALAQDGIELIGVAFQGLGQGLFRFGIERSVGRLAQTLHIGES